MDKRIAGFSLMEVVAVLAVVAILATLAVPSYFEGIVRDQVKQALPLANVPKPNVAAAWRGTLAFPADNAAAGLPVPEKIVGNYVSSTVVHDGAITITFGNNASRAIAGKQLTMRPAVVEDEPVVPIAWVCGFADGPNGMAVHGENRTSVAQGLLPVECRGSGK